MVERMHDLPFVSQVFVVPPVEESTGLLPVSMARPIGSFITAFCLVTIGLNVFVCYMVYKKRGLRSSSTAIMIANLACVDVLVTLKDLPLLLAASSSGRWYFEEAWCASYGLTNVIFIIVSVSTLVTITTERYCHLRDRARDADAAVLRSDSSSRPVLLGYVIAHTTLSYSLSLLWSKYTFITRKAFCRIEWPPRQGWSLTFMTSCVFILPVSMLIYNILYRSFFDNADSKKISSQRAEDVEENNAEAWEIKAHVQLQASVGLFLLSWAPYVIESVVSGYLDVSPNVGILTACIPLFSTSLMPIMYVRFLREEPRVADCSNAMVIVQ